MKYTKQGDEILSSGAIVAESSKLKNKGYIIIVEDITDASTRSAKIGKTSRNPNRPEKDLYKKYNNTSKNIIVKVLPVFDLPDNGCFSINDKAIHDELKKLGLKSREKHYMKGLLNGEKQGYTEFFDCSNITNDQLENYVKKAVAEAAKKASNYKIPLPDINDIDIKINQDYRHEVTSTNIDLIQSLSKEWKSNTAIIVAGQLNKDYIKAKALSTKIIIKNDNPNIEKIEKTNIKSIDNNIVYYDTVIKEIYNMNNTFNIIANPPYSLTGQFLDSMLTNVNFKEFIIIAPLSDLLKYYDHIKSIQPADPKAFADASITDNLSIAEITKEPCNKFRSEDDLYQVTYDKTLLKFYSRNIAKQAVSNSPIANYSYAGKSKCANGKLLDDVVAEYRNDIMDKFEDLSKKQFILSGRPCGDGIHSSGFDYDWNIKKQITSDEITLWRNIKSQKVIEGYSTIYFNTEEEKKNFTEFYYRSKLSALLLDGLNKSAGTPIHAFPDIDWSHPWTDEEILKEYGYTDAEIKEILA